MESIWPRRVGSSAVIDFAALISTGKTQDADNRFLLIKQQTDHSVLCSIGSSL